MKINSVINSIYRKIFLYLLNGYVKRNPAEAFFWFFSSPCMVAAAWSVMKLGIPAFTKDKYLTIKELGDLTRCSEDSLYRIIRALESIGLFEKDKRAKYRLTKSGHQLCKSHPRSFYHYAAAMNETYMPLLKYLAEGMQAGKSTIEVGTGQSLWDFYASHPQEEEVFDHWMAGFTSQHAAAILEAVDFSKFSTIVDIGGGRGALLAEILNTYPSISAILCERPSVIPRSIEFLVEKGVETRCDVRAVDFFKELPVGADLYIVKHVFHDWSDEQVLRTLRCIDSAIDGKCSARLLIMEGLVEHNLSEGEFLRQWCDVMQMIWTEGKERQLSTYNELLESAGFRLYSVVPTRVSDLLVLEAGINC